MKSFKDLESIGWKFWVVLSILLMYPSYLAVKTYTYSTASTSTRIGFGIFTAAIIAAIIAAGLNDLLFRWKAKARNQQRKTERKEKRKRRK